MRTSAVASSFRGSTKQSHELEAAQAGGRLAQVAISFNKRTYRFQCGEDDVERLEQLAIYLKSKLDALMLEHGALGDERLVLMAALTIADELFDARADIDDLLEDQTGKLQDKLSEARGAPKAGASDATGAVPARRPSTG